MGRIARFVFLTVLIGVFILAGCGEREEMGDEPVSEDEPTPTATEAPSPTVEPTVTPEPTPTPDPETAEARELDIPQYEISSGNREIYVIDANGENEARITDDDIQHSFPVWSPDGERIASITHEREQPGQPIFVMNADGSDLQEITDDAGHGRIAWSPDGETIAFGTEGNPNVGADEIHLVDANGANQRQLTNRDGMEPGDAYSGVRSLAWSPNDEMIVFTGMRLAHEETGNAVIELYVVDVDGDGTPRRLTDIPEIQKGDPVWSPDGQTIAFTGTSVDDYEQAIYTVDANGENLQNLTEDTSHASSPAWSPDGARIAFTRDLFGSNDIYVMDADGSNVQQLTDTDTANESPVWSPDGDRIAFVATRDARLAEPCSYGEMVDAAPSEPFEDLAWVSHQVVVGTVLEEKEPTWAEPDVVDHPDGSRAGNCLQIMTDYVVEVEDRYRGEPAATLRVRTRGGQIGEYEPDIWSSPIFREGDRVLLFLTEAPESELLADAYTAHRQRSWTIGDGDIISGDELDSFDEIDLTEVEERIRDSLNGDPQNIGSRLIPLDEAPVPE